MVSCGLAKLRARSFTIDGSIAGRFGKFEEVGFIKLFMFRFPFKFGRFFRFSQKKVVMFEGLIEAPLILASGIMLLGLFPEGVF